MVKIKRKSGAAFVSQFPIAVSEEMLTETADPVTPDWNRCPVELLVNVFGNLGVLEKQRVALVCTKWRDVVYLPPLWTEVVVVLAKPTDVLYASLVRRGVKAVKVRNESILDDILASIPDLEHLDLQTINPSLPRLSRLFGQPLDHFKVLNLINCRNVTDAIVSSVCSNAINLTYLNLCVCCKLTNSSLKTIADCLKKLERLELGGCKLITDVGIGYLSSGEFPLECLGLSGLPKIGEGSLLHIGEGIGRRSLKELTLHDCPGLTDTGLINLVQERCTIKYLDLSCCIRLTDNGMMYLARIPTLDRLVIADLPKLTDKALLHLVPLNLIQLDVGNLNRLTDVGAEYLSRMTRLRVLNASCSDWEGRCVSRYTNVEHKYKGLGDAGMAFLSSMPSLQQLSVSGTGVGDVGLAYLAKSNLEVLNISDCDRVSDYSMEFVAKMEHLRSLTVSECDNLKSFRGPELLIKGGSGISSLVASGCSWCSPKSLGLLSKLTELRELVMGDCDVTDAGLAKLAGGGSRVAKLDLHDTSVSDAGMKYLAKMSNLRQVNLTETDVTCAGLAYLDSVGIKADF